MLREDVELINQSAIIITSSSEQKQVEPKYWPKARFCDSRIITLVVLELEIANTPFTNRNMPDELTSPMKLYQVLVDNERFDWLTVKP